MTEEVAATDTTAAIVSQYRESGPGAWVQREVGPTMNMQEMVGWLQTNFGGGIRDALQQAAFMLCCDVISQDVGKATLRLRELMPNGTRRTVLPTQHEVAALLATEPNKRHTWEEFSEMLMYWGCFSNNAHAYAKRNNQGDILELVPLQGGRAIELIAGNEVFYEISAATLYEQALLGFQSVRAPERDVLHVRWRMLNGMDGYSPMIAGYSTLQAGKAIDEYRGNLFNEDGQMRGVFVRKDPPSGPLPDLPFERLRSQFRQMMTNFRRLTDPIVLEGDFDFKPISANPKEMDLTNQFVQQVVATCRLLRVPPHKVFGMDSVKYENLETLEKSYVGDTLIPRCKPVEQRLAKLLLTAKDRLRFVVEYDREEMTLKDTKAETDRAVRSLERGAITWDEFRATMGKNPLPNGQGNHRLVPTNMNVIDENGVVVVQGTAASSSSKPADESGAENPPTDGSGDAPADGEQPTAKILRLR